MSAVRDAQGGVAFVSCIMRDVTEKLRAERHIEHLATTDTLTGLANRNALLQKMADAVARAARTRGQLAVMFIGLRPPSCASSTLPSEAFSACLETLDP